LKGQFGTLKVKAKRLVCGEIEEEVIELDLNRGDEWMKSVRSICLGCSGFYFYFIKSNKIMLDGKTVCRRVDLLSI
jgi:hypothetical protein